MTATINKIISYATISAMVVALSFVFTVQTAGAQTYDHRVSRLGELVVLNNLFDGNGINGVTNGHTSNLGELIVVDGLFAPGDYTNGDEYVSGSSGNTRVSRLGELITLTGLFDDKGTSGDVVIVESGDTLRGIAAEFLGDASLAGEIARVNGLANPNLIFPGQRLTLPNVSTNGNSTSDLGELIVLDGLFAPSSDGVTGSGRVSRLGELVVLENLFKGNGITGYNGGNATNLGELIVLDGLFAPAGIF